MSKLSDSIKTSITNKRVISDYSNYSFTYNTRSPSDYDQSYDRKVSFTAVFGAECYLAEELTYNTEVLDSILKDIRQKVVHEIFGEFKDPIHAIVAQLYRREYDKALESVHELERKMFSV